MPNLNNYNLKKKKKKKKKNRQLAAEAEIPHSFYSWATHLEHYGAYRAEDHNHVGTSAGQQVVTVEWIQHQVGGFFPGGAGGGFA